LASRIFNAPICLVSLVDVDRQWFKSRIGVEVMQTHRNSAFCSYTVLPESSEVFVVEDAHADERFKNNPLVTGPPYVRFYAGAAIIVDNVRIGSFCVIDTEARTGFKMKHKMNLLDMGWMVSELIQRDLDEVKASRGKATTNMFNLCNEVNYPLQNVQDCAFSLRTACANLVSDKTYSSLHSSPEFSSLRLSALSLIADIDYARNYVDAVLLLQSLMNDMKEASLELFENRLIRKVFEASSPYISSRPTQATPRPRLEASANNPFGCSVLSTVGNIQMILSHLLKFSSIDWVFEYGFDGNKNVCFYTLYYAQLSH